MTTTIKQKPVLDQFGNIRLHATEGLDLPIQRKSSGGTLIDISGAVYVFYIDGLGSFPAVPGADVYEKRIQITPLELEDMVIGTQSTYALVDESGDVPITLMDGKIKLEGFRAS